MIIHPLPSLNPLHENTFDLLFGALSVQGAPYYDGYSEDRAALRKTYRLGNPPLNASSGPAIEAARRLFSKVPFLGITRQEALLILGDPHTEEDPSLGLLIASIFFAPYS